MSRPKPETAIVVRAIGAGGLEALAELHAACFAEAWDREALAAMLAMPGAFAFLAQEGAPAEDGSRALGFVMAWAVAGEAEIISLGVRPDLRRSGIGRRLLAAAVAESVSRGTGRLFLEVAADNEAAYALYLGAGFVQVGRRADYYHRPGGDVAALVLARELAGQGNPGSQIKQDS